MSDERLQATGPLVIIILPSGCPLTIVFKCLVAIL